MGESRPLVLIIGRFDANMLVKATHHKDIEFKHFSQWDGGLIEHPQVQGLIIRSNTKVDEKFLEKMPALKVIITATAGFDHIDFSAARVAGITVGHVPDAPVQSVAELFLLLALSACRKQKLVQMQMAQGNWARETLTGTLLKGKVLGIVGCGRIGRAVAEMGSRMEMRALGFDPFIEDIPPTIEMVGYDELLRSCDVLTFHVPKTPQTRHMLNQSTLASVHSDIIVINTSRGSVINESQLALFLQENPKAQAGLDVFENEPLSMDSPLYKLPNVVMSPHIGAATDECLSASSFQAIKSIENFFAGQAIQHPLPPQARWWQEAFAK